MCCSSRSATTVLILSSQDIGLLTLDHPMMRSPGERQRTLGRFGDVELSLAPILSPSDVLIRYTMIVEARPKTLFIGARSTRLSASVCLALLSRVNLTA